MPEESRDSLAEYRQQVIGALVEQRSIVASVCQLCGEISHISGFFGWTAFVDVDGKREFICADCGDKRGRRTGRKLLQESATRFCESCRKRFRPTQKKDIAYWVCDPCIRNIPCPPNEVREFLRDLTVQRYLQGSGMSNDSLRDWHIKLAIEKFDMEGLRQNPIEKLRLEATREKRLEALLKRLSDFHGLGPSKIATETPNQDEKSRNVIDKDGDIWTITFRGNSVHLRDLKGLTYIVYLLQHPNESISATQLVEITTEKQTGELHNEMSKQQIEEEGLRQVVDLGDSGKAADPKTLKEVRRRLLEIEEEKVRAEQVGDSEKYDELEETTEQLERYLNKNYGLGNKPRRAGSHADRMRVNVNRAIQRVVGKIRKQNEALATYLNSTIKTGFQVSYTPDPNNPASWTFNIS